jgi:hypothetical protein
VWVWVYQQRQHAGSEVMAAEVAAHSGGLDDTAAPDGRDGSGVVPTVHHHPRGRARRQQRQQRCGRACQRRRLQCLENHLRNRADGKNHTSDNPTMTLASVLSGRLNEHSALLGGELLCAVTVSIQAYPIAWP